MTPRLTRLAAPAIALTLALSAPAPAEPAGRFAPSTVEALAPGASVELRGRVERIIDAEDEFLLADETGTVEVYLEGDGLGLSEGETVTVRGRVDDDGPLEIYADEVLTGDGRVLRARRWE